MKEKTGKRAIMLAIVSACIFFLSSLLLRHWLLVGSSILFAIGHLNVTKENINTN
ncbi:MAG: hypothetical protein IJI46_06855 [Erysipelotrichaceae bacterium]|nr:hypothetical protein [Erysipelotrichaceae bacterium]